MENYLGVQPKFNIQKSQFWIYKWIEMKIIEEKLCPYLCFTAENKMGNLNKAGHIPALIWWMRYSISSRFTNLLMNWVTYVFHLKNFVHATGFLSLRKALLILLSLYLQMLMMQISTQTDNNKSRKNFAAKKVLFEKTDLKSQNILCKIAFIF